MSIRKGNNIIASGGVTNPEIIRAVSPACTVITATDTTAIITANTTYAHKPTTGCVYTLATPSALNVYSGFILILDTTNSANVSFQTDGNPAVTVTLNKGDIPEIGKHYTVTGQFDVINQVWNLWIMEYSAS